MSNLAVVIVCLCLGLLLQRLRAWPTESATSLNLYVIYIALPALVFAEIPKLSLDRHALLPVVFAWGIMVTSALLTWVTARLFHWSRAVTGVLMLTVPLGNTGFVGLPLIDALLGAEAIPYAILYDQFGTFLALNTYGIIMACYYAGTATAWSKILQKIVTFPPFVALVFAFATLWLDYPSWLANAFSRIAATLVPVVMVAVGLQWQMRVERATLTPLLIGLLYILIVTPALTFVALKGLGLSGLTADVILLQSAMPAMISAGVLAMSHNLLPRLASSLVGYSLLLSLFTTWCWRTLLL